MLSNIMVRRRSASVIKMCVCYNDSEDFIDINVRIGPVQTGLPVI